MHSVRRDVPLCLVAPANLIYAQGITPNISSMKYLRAVLIVALFLTAGVSGYARPAQAALTVADAAKIQELLQLVAQLQAQLIQLQQSNRSASLTVTYPRGGEIFADGIIVNIGWAPNGPTQPGIKKIELISTSSSRRKTLFTTVGGDAPIYDGHYEVEIPRSIFPSDATSGYFKIRVTDTNGKRDSSEIFRINKKG